jgi:hypothetical protein
MFGSGWSSKRMISETTGKNFIGLLPLVLLVWLRYPSTVLVNGLLRSVTLSGLQAAITILPRASKNEPMSC